MKKKKPQILQAPKGSRDILPVEHEYWRRFLKAVASTAEDYGYQKIETPILEEAALFEQGFDGTVLNRQTIKTAGGITLVLRPNVTFGIARSYLEHGMASQMPPFKFFYGGPVFQADTHQTGFIKQMYRFGVEAIGDGDPVVDAQIIQFCYNTLRNSGLKKLSVNLNSIGCHQCRNSYRRGLLDHYRHRKNNVCSDCRKKMKESPLELLFCREEKCQPVKAQAPVIVDYLCEDCHQHFKAVLEFLDDLDMPYFLNNSLMDAGGFRTKTAFEIIWEEEDSSGRQVLASGGRYDNLIKELGGKNTPMAGGVLNVEAIIGLMKREQVKTTGGYAPKVFLAQLGDRGKKKSLKLFESLHQAGITTAEALSRDSIKTQLHNAEKLGTPFALIMGQQEALDGTVIIRDMQSGVQETLSQEKVVDEIKKRLRK